MNTEGAMLRRYQDDLHVSGLGAVIMGMWSVVRAAMELFFGSIEFMEVFKEEETFPLAEFIVACILVGALFAALLTVHSFVGINAVRAAKGEKYRKGYFVMALIMLAINVLGLLTYTDIMDDLENIDTNIAALLVDLVTVYIFFTIVRSTLKIKKLSTEQTQE